MDLLNRWGVVVFFIQGFVLCLHVYNHVSNGVTQT